MSVRAKDDEKKPKIDLFKNDIRFRHHIEYVETIPEKEAEYMEVDDLEDNALHYHNHTEGFDVVGTVGGH